MAWLRKVLDDAKAAKAAWPAWAQSKSKMTAKTLRNPALRTKFKVGDTFKFPKDVWTKLTKKMINLPSVGGTVIDVGDQIIQHGKNRLCRFTVTFRTDHELLFGDLVIWEEWMLDRLVLMYDGQKKEESKPCEACEQQVPG